MLTILLADTDAFLDKGLFDAAYRQMPAPRRRKIDRFRYDKDKRLSLGAGLLLELALRDAGLAGTGLAVSLGEEGKPFFRDRPELCFNLSHSGHYAVCALSDQGEVGVDVQRTGHAKDGLLRKVCTRRERDVLSSLPETERNDAFFRLWTIKESYVKLLGTGLTLALERLETEFGPPVSIRRDGAPQPVRFDQWEFETYWLTLCSTASGRPALEALTRDELSRRCGLRSSRGEPEQKP